jgi:transposase-like protein
MRGSKHSRRRRNYRVEDRARLARALSEVIKTRFSDSQSAAAREWGIDQSTLSRLIGQRRAQITPRLATRLIDVLPEESATAVAASLLTPRAYDALTAHRNWLEMRELWFRYSFRVPNSGSRTARISVSITRSHDRIEDRREMLAEMAALCSAQLRKFLRGVAKQGLANSPRVAVALNNVIAPLVERGIAGSIERGGGELTREEFIQFVEAGLVREEILLNRSPDAIRAQEVSEKDSASVGLDAIADPRSHVVRRLPNLSQKLLDSVAPVLSSIGL